VWKDKGLVRDMLAQARENGFHALALTVVGRCSLTL